MLKDKNHGAVFEKLAEVADHWYLAELQQDRAASVTELTGALARHADLEKVGQFRTVRGALAEAGSRTRIGDRIIVTGSFRHRRRGDGLPDGPVN